MIDNEWQQLPPGKAKYQAYLASREWGCLREAVRERAHGWCERCAFRPGDAVHHRTYARIYQEDLDDLVLICDECHTWVHGRRAIDPIIARAIVDGGSVSSNVDHDHRHREYWFLGLILLVLAMLLMLW